MIQVSFIVVDTNEFAKVVSYVINYLTYNKIQHNFPVNTPVTGSTTGTRAVISIEDFDPTKMIEILRRDFNIDGDVTVTQV